MVSAKIGVPDDPAMPGNGAGIGLRKEDTALKTKIDGAIAGMIKDGSLANAMHA